MKIDPVAITLAVFDLMWRKVSKAARLVIGVFKEAPLMVVFLMALAVGVPWIILAAVQRENAEQEWVAAGICEPVMEQMYLPPATSSCSSYNKDGACTLWTTNQPPPYLRTLLNCEGKKEFWRRSNKLPQDMRDQVRKIGKKD